jgi:hypothetical protein
VPTRRELLASAATAAATLAAPGAFARAPRRREPAALARARVRLIERPRPIVFNSDSDVLLHGVSGPDEYVARRFAAIADTQVATLADCTGNTLLLAQRNAFAERYDDEGLNPPREQACAESELCSGYARSVRALDAAGTDALDVGARFCREHGLEHFWSYRVNDVHDSLFDWQLTRFKRDRPEWLLASRGESRDPDSPRSRSPST